jgi:hypothetical protein
MKGMITPVVGGWWLVLGGGWWVVGVGSAGRQTSDRHENAKSVNRKVNNVSHCVVFELLDAGFRKSPGIF